jgi:uncharacterized protein DUF1707/uncharacterized protein DUF4190
VAVDPAFDTTLSLSGGNGASRRYDAGSGYGTAAGPSWMLAADADRERAIDVLKAGFAEGRLTRAEHDDRTARVYAARTYGELGALIADLPAGPLGHPVHYPSIGYPLRQMARPATNSLAVAALACGIGEFLTMGLTAIPAIVLGHAARRQVRKTGQRGDGMALAGLTLGWIGLLTAIIAGLIIAASVSRHSPHSVFARPISGAPGGPLQGG